MAPSTWTAVVGSLTAGESARIAMSTRIRSANAGSCSIVRSSPITNMPRRRSAGGGAGPYTRSTTSPCGTMSPTACGRTSRQSWRIAVASSPSLVDRLDRPRAAGRDLERRRCAGVARLAVGGFGSGRLHRVEHLRAGVGDDPGHRDRPQAVDEAIEVDEEQHDARRDRHAGERDADVRHRAGTDPAQQSQRERERSDERPEHRLLQPVAVPEPHESRRQRLGRHLHDEHPERHHEPGQPDHRADDRAQDGARGRLRVRPARRQVQLSLDHGRQLGEHRAGQGTDERDHPQAALQALPPLEAGGP